MKKMLQIIMAIIALSVASFARTPPAYSISKYTTEQMDTYFGWLDTNTPKLIWGISSVTGGSSYSVTTNNGLITLIVNTNEFIGPPGLTGATGPAGTNAILSQTVDTNTATVPSSAAVNNALISQSTNLQAQAIDEISSWSGNWNGATVAMGFTTNGGTYTVGQALLYTGMLNGRPSFASGSTFWLRFETNEWRFYQSGITGVKATNTSSSLLPPTTNWNGWYKSSSSPFITNSGGAVVKLPVFKNIETNFSAVYSNVVSLSTNLNGTAALLGGVIRDVKQAGSPLESNEWFNASYYSQGSLNTNIQNLISTVAKIRTNAPISVTLNDGTTTFYTNPVTAFAGMGSGSTMLVWSDIPTGTTVLTTGIITNSFIVGVGGERNRRTIIVDSSAYLNISSTSAFRMLGVSNSLYNLDMVNYVNNTNASAYGYCLTGSPYLCVENCGIYMTGQYKHSVEGGGYKALVIVTDYCYGSRVTNCTVGTFPTNYQAWVRLGAFHGATNNSRLSNLSFVEAYTNGLDPAGTGSVTLTNCVRNSIWPTDNGLADYTLPLVKAQLSVPSYLQPYLLNTNNVTYPIDSAFESLLMAARPVSSLATILQNMNKGVFVSNNVSTNAFSSAKGMFLYAGELGGYILSATNRFYSIARDGANWTLFCETLNYRSLDDKTALWTTTNAPTYPWDGQWISANTNNSTIAVPPNFTRGWDVVPFIY